ncbi:ligand of Numb protein X 2-like isoform X1 [Phascolarctos cinereus]|uniref:Ligand of Numb protein X 2-like isoform X1 n=2 Tax=Phascolarctos cinereus TaxID=38626 RepID=A0A6P5JHQ0_PHACI|nr:ligand of Numb protein X 2-like isoform X1 [Phascolarctos cinereus]
MRIQSQWVNVCPAPPPLHNLVLRMAFSTLNSTPPRADGELCPSCGQLHQALDNHLYNFQDEVDDELTCNICLQPLLQPVDTPCGHTYCYRCLESFLQDSDFCPMDREPLTFPSCRKSTLLVRNLLDKLIVFCPFPPDCLLTMQRCELEGHLQNRCPGLRKYQAKMVEEKCQPDHKKQEVPLEPEASNPCGENFFDIDAILSMDSEYSSVAPMVPWSSPEPGLVNPAFEETDEDSILSLSTSDLTRSNSLVAETVVVEISRDNSEKELGMRIVGGKDTPLGNIVVQEVHQDTPLGMDGKVAPGDHVLEVNGINISDVTHSQAISLLRQAGPVLQLVILQEKGFLNKPLQDDSPIPSRAGEIVHVTLMKKDRLQPLGIKLIRKAGKAGIFILDLLDGGLAAKNGKLSQNDKVLSINGQDLRQGTPETAAQIIQTSESRVHFVVLRPRDSLIMEMETDSGSSRPSRSGGRSSESDGSSGTSNHISLSHGNSPPPISVPQWKPELGHYPRPLAFYKDPPAGFLSQEKTLTIRKDVKESLGITIGGGREGKHSVPIYVTSVQPVGCLCRDSRIQRGNILLSINGIDLTLLSYQEAVAVLKSQAASTTIVLKALDILMPPGSLEPWAGGQEPPVEYGPSWSPLWLSWLGLPSALHLCQDVVLHKNTDESWGFSIVGGFEVSKGNQPFFIKTIVPGTPAFRDRRLKCGDEIVAVNGTPAAGMSNAQLIPMLKELRNRVALTVVSWPGSLV